MSKVHSKPQNEGFASQQIESSKSSPPKTSFPEGDLESSPVEPESSQGRAQSSRRHSHEGVRVEPSRAQSSPVEPNRASPPRNANCQICLPFRFFAEKISKVLEFPGIFEIAPGSFCKPNGIPVVVHILEACHSGRPGCQCVAMLNMFKFF